MRTRIPPAALLVALLTCLAMAEQVTFTVDRAGYLPPDAAFRCPCPAAWIRSKAMWRLSMDRREAEAIAAALQACR